MKKSQIREIVKEAIEESLWDNINAKRKSGRKPARKGSKAYKAAAAAGKKLMELDASTPAPNEIPGGLAQFSTIGDLATMHNLPLDQIIKQIIKGVKAESEHTTNLDIAMEIAFDHVYEDPKYYDKLASIEEGKHDPVEPGILKKRLGKLTCSKVRAAKAGLEDKGTHYAKALQRYLNYHCQ
jgi:hypothetical protein